MINGENAIWYKNKGYTNVFAYSSKAGCYHIYWQGSLEELIQMAESIEVVSENDINGYK